VIPVLRELRVPFLSASVVNVLFGGATAYYCVGAVDWLKFALCVVGVALGHLGSNVANDYFDHRSGNDEANPTPTPFSGGSRVIQRGLMSPRAVLVEALVCFAGAAAIGLYLNAVSPGNTVLWIALTGGLLGYLYTAWPVRLGYRGLGELTIAIAFGPLPVLGTHFVLTHRFDAVPILGGCALGLLVALILYANEFPDYNADKAVDKRTLPVLLGLRAGWVGYVVVLAAAYGVIAVGVVAAVLPRAALIGLLPLPLGLWAARHIRQHLEQPLALVPACAATVILHAATGMLLAVGVAMVGK